MIGLGALLVLVVASPSANAESSRRASFPGDPVVLGSPDGRYSVRWVAPASETDEHHLLLADARARSEVELLAFPRGVDVLWSHSGRRLAISNHWASDEATVLLWEALPSRPRDLLEELVAYEHEAAAKWSAHHLYLEAEAWQGDDVLFLRLWGYGDTPQSQLNQHYRYTVGVGFSRK
jgi:hypothetical protein